MRTSSPGHSLRWSAVIAGACFAAGLAAGLTGCTTRPDAQTSTATRTSTPSSTRGAVPILRAVPPPTSETDAINEANETVLHDELMLFTVQQLSVAASQFGRFEAGQYRHDMETNLNDEFEDVLDADSVEYDYAGMSGQPRAWFPNAARSSAATHYGKGKPIQFGAVHLVGCFKDRRIFTFAVQTKPGSPAPTPTPTPISGQATAKLIPTIVTVQYQPAKRVWLITDETPLGSAERPTLCS